MALHDELLDLAVRLAGAAAPSAAGRRRRGVPKPEAELRRAISTAYYALFHLLIHASTCRGVGQAALRPFVARNFEHRQMLGVCRRYTGATADVTGGAVRAGLQRVAGCFMQLQEARHKADYNVKDRVTVLEAQTAVGLAQDAFLEWRAVEAEPAADVYLTELLVGGIKER